MSLQPSTYKRIGLIGLLILLALSIVLWQTSGVPKTFVTPTSGKSSLLIFLFIALSTLVTEDITCIGAGVMIAEGRISFPVGGIACLVGIFAGELLLFWAGRCFGRLALRRAPLKWFVREADVERCSIWFGRRGVAAIAISRFIPGTRLPTYFAAGLLDTSLWKFSLYFLVAAAVWTPLLVGGAVLAGDKISESILITQRSYFLKSAGIVGFVFLVVRIFLQVTTFRGRRLLVGRWRRLTHWEFWPLWFFYPPVVLYVIYLGIKYRSLTLFTCVNPAIEESGFVGESKFAILSGLKRNAPQFIPL